MATRRILMARSHFEVLALPETMATASTVRSSFLREAQRVHPDKSDSPDAGAAFVRLQVAYDALSCQNAQAVHLSALRRARALGQSAQRRYTAAPERTPSRAEDFLDKFSTTKYVLLAAVAFVSAEVVMLITATNDVHPEVMSAAATPYAPPAIPVSYPTNQLINQIQNKRQERRSREMP